MRRGLLAAVRPVEDALKDSAVSVLPSGGGLGSWVARQLEVTPTATSSGDTVTITVKIRIRGHDLPSINRGRVMHPTYGRLPMQLQIVPAGFVTDALKGPVADRVRKDMGRVLEDTARQIAREARG